MLENFTSDDVARLAYLLALAGLLLGYGALSRRANLGEKLRGVLLWLLIILGVAAGYGLWQNNPALTGAMVSQPGRVELTRGGDGHFHLTLQVTGPSGKEEPVRVVLDTGASELVLRREDAARLGFQDLDFQGTARTANGTVRTASVWLDRVRLGESRQTRVRALVNEGELFTSLLGMGYLAQFSRIEIRGERLVIEF
jgi:aspartyl protease family protein